MEAVTQVTVFVASPGDVAEERDAITQVIQELNEIGLGGGRVVLQLKKWETHAWPGFGVDAQDVINQQIGDYDIFVGILWNRLGTPTKRSASGTVEEFERAYEAWKKNRRPSLFFYFLTAPASFSEVKDLRQKELVIKFKKALQKLGALTWDFTDAEEFAKLTRRHLLKEIEKITSQPAAAPLPSPVNPEKAAIDHINDLVRKLGYWHEGPTRQVLTSIQRAALESGSDAVKNAAIAGIRDFIMTGLFDDDEEAVMRARGLRKAAFAVIHACATPDAAAAFSKGELEALDLFEFDFSGLRLPDISFRGAFLLEANFGKAILDRASFEGAWIRNVDFALASLRDADFSGADWFNALNLTADQLRSVKPGTLLEAPANVEGMHAYLQQRYRLPFDSWSQQVRNNLTAAWGEYLKPGGVRELLSPKT